MNPKDAQATAEGKVRLDLLEPAGNEACARALEFGAITKGYGIQNYLQVPISARTYLAAAQRHLDELKQGEDLAPDSLVHHWGHILANGHIWLASLEAGTLVDDRGPAEPGPHPINTTPVGPQMACKDESGRGNTLAETAEAISRLFVGADDIVDRIQTAVEKRDADRGTLVDREDEGLLCPADTPMGSCSPRCGDSLCETAANVVGEVQWATAEEKEEFWQDIGRPVDPPLGVGDRVRVKGTCTFRANRTGEIVEQASSVIPERDWKVRFDLDGLEFYFSGYELERAPEEPCSPEEPRPLQVGDRVRIVGKRLYIGQEGEIDKIENLGWAEYRVRVNELLSLWYSASELERVS